MNEMNDRLMDIFFDIQGGLSRQGPGDDQSTKQALSFCDGLSDAPLILDIGCGPGAQTLVLADALPNAHIIATDIHAPYLETLKVRSVGKTAHITTEIADMAALPFEPSRFDLLWSEGAAYIMGVKEALEAWYPLLKPGGYLALTELVWLVDTPPDKVARFFNSEYPTMTHPKAIMQLFQDAGYRILGHFILPDHAWWDEYYTPLASRLPEMEVKYKDDKAALSIIEMTKEEQSIRKEFSSSYGYVFFIGQKTD